jgi:threonine/homoserine/homoserine lactone efflux protein
MDLANLALFFIAALVIAVSPGPGLLYVAARTLAGGRSEGLASSFGTGLGGLVHVAAGAVGVSALVLASAEAFTLLKIAGAIYLVWLGIKTLREARRPIAAPLATSIEATAVSTGSARAFREGIVVEALNPKTAAFFLAFLPQFVDPAAGPVWLQFLLLGLVSVTLNTAADLVVAVLAARARSLAVARPGLLRRLRQGAGLAIASLGLSLFLARRPATL